MHKERFAVGNYVHVVNRGARGFPIVGDELDRWRFLLMLHHFNDKSRIPENWFRQLQDEGISSTFKRPRGWQEQIPIVRILSFCFMENHFHILFKEIEENGISTFMQKFGTGMANHFNTKYKQKGSLFQGPFKARTITTDEYLRCVVAYINVKNPFELFPGGLSVALTKFEDAYERASAYQYASLMEYSGKRTAPLLQKDILGELFPTPRTFKAHAREYILGRRYEKDEDIPETLE